MKKPKRDKKRIIAASIAIFLAIVMLLSVLAPFIFA